MTVTRIEITIIPNTEEGRKFANEYEERLKRQRVLYRRKTDTVNISIEAKYHISMEDGGE